MQLTPFNPPVQRGETGFRPRDRITPSNRSEILEGRLAIFWATLLKRRQLRSPHW